MAYQYRERSAEAWEKRANQSSSDFESWLKDEYRAFTPAKGENHIRILPPTWEGANHYGMDAYVHYGIGPERGSVLCLFKMREEACPICEERARAERARDEELIRELRVTKRVAVFLLNQKDPAQGPLVWGMPFTVDREISKASKDRSTGTFYFIDHPTQGFDVYFDTDGEQLLTKYTGVSLARRASAIPEKLIDWLEQNPLPEVLRWRTYEEVKRLYEGAGRGERAEDRPAGGSDRLGSRAGASSRSSGRRRDEDVARTDARNARRDEESEPNGRGEPSGGPGGGPGGNGRAEAATGNGRTTGEEIDDHIPDHAPERSARPPLQRPLTRPTAVPPDDTAGAGDGAADAAPGNGATAPATAGRDRVADLRARFMTR